MAPKPIKAQTKKKGVLFLSPLSIEKDPEFLLYSFVEDPLDQDIKDASEDPCGLAVPLNSENFKDAVIAASENLADMMEAHNDLSSSDTTPIRNLKRKANPEQGLENTMRLSDGGNFHEVEVIRQMELSPPKVRKTAFVCYEQGGTIVCVPLNKEAEVQKPTCVRDYHYRGTTSQIVKGAKRIPIFSAKPTVIAATA